MRLEYSSNKLKRILEDERLISKYYSKISTALKNRLTELRAAECLNDIPENPPPKRHKLMGDYNNCWGVSVSKNFRMILEPIGEYDINDLSSIHSVKILKIEDYH